MSEQLHYKIDFDFTTFHPGSRFVGRSGTCVVDTNKPITKDHYEAPGLIEVCLQVIIEKKPKWKVFMIKVKGHQEVVQKENGKYVKKEAKG